MNRRGLYILTIVLLLTSVCTSAQTRSLKRGLAYGHNSTQDLTVLSPGVSWWYNWYHQSEVSSFEGYNIDFVPMAWDATFDKNAMHTFLSTHPSVKYILGWNEPNFTTQSNLTPKQAAAHWPDIESLADEFNLKIVSPAVNYCDKCVSEDGTTYGDPVQYLDAFFEACPNCRVDYIAIHNYMSNVSALQWYVGLFKKYNKPIWLTEFCSWENVVTLSSQESYMIGAVDYLENDPDVFRYAWFTGRQDSAYPYNAVLGGSGALTELGNIYVNTPVHDSLSYAVIPTRIEAESYTKMNGILLEKTSDVSGMANVGYIDAGDWLEYQVDALAKDTFNISFRVAVNQAASIALVVDNVPVETVSLAASGGWQNWVTVQAKDPVILEGKHKVRLKAQTGGFNINWFELKPPVIVTGVDDLLDNKSTVVYPNPVDDKLIVNTSLKIDRLTVYDLQGNVLHSGLDNVVDFSSIKPGLYLVKIISKDKISCSTNSFMVTGSLLLLRKLCSKKLTLTKKE